MARLRFKIYDEQYNTKSDSTLCNNGRPNKIITADNKRTFEVEIKNINYLTL